MFCWVVYDCIVCTDVTSQLDRLHRKTWLAGAFTLVGMEKVDWKHCISYLQKNTILLWFTATWHTGCLWPVVHLLIFVTCFTMWHFCHKNGIGGKCVWWTVLIVLSSNVPFLIKTYQKLFQILWKLLMWIKPEVETVWLCEWCIYLTTHNIPVLFKNVVSCRVGCPKCW